MKSYIQTLLFTVISAQPFSPITKVIVRKQKRKEIKLFLINRKFRNNDKQNFDSRQTSS